MSDRPAYPLPEGAQTLLEERFGHPAFRPEQRQAIGALLAGRDVLLILPTGGGKSLCYQLPALLNPRPTLVVSPLIALMEDQVQALVARGIAASYVNSSLDARQREQRLKAFQAGRVKLLYVTPERFRSPAFQAALAETPIGLLAIDEAHCISTWGQDFRPDYWQLGRYRRALGNPPTIALTATATAQTRRDICTQLELADPVVLVGPIDRPNLFLKASAYGSTQERSEALLQRLDSLAGPGIVYVTLIRTLEELADRIRRRGREPLIYHGELSSLERRDMQARFMASQDAVVLATNAFGLGIDKAQTRFVLHGELPRTLEAWTQELGRAGRDGQPAWTELFAAEEDLAVAQGFISWANPELDAFLRVYHALFELRERLPDVDADELSRLAFSTRRADGRLTTCLTWLTVLGVLAGRIEEGNLQWLGELDPERLPAHFGGDEKRVRELSRLLAMWRLCSEPATCRRAVLAEAFGATPPDGPCGACDACCDPEAWLAEHPALHRRPPALPGESTLTRGDSPWQRGDWVRIDGRHLGLIVKVERLGKDPLLIVEDPRDHRRRRVAPRKRRVERLEGPAA